MMSAINQDDEDTPFDEILDNLEAVVGLASRAESLASGWCCCGGRSNSHGIGDGHSPVDDNERHADSILAEARAVISKHRSPTDAD